MTTRCQICAPIVAPNLLAAQQQLANIVTTGADIAELWLGELQSPDPATLAEFITNSPLPLLVNCKDGSEQGHFIGSPREKLQLLQTTAQAGAHWVDVDYQWQQIAELRASLPASCELILSAHFWQATPTLTELSKLAATMRQRGAEIVKIVTMPQTAADTLVVMQLAVELTAAQQPHICIAMGELGQITRRESNWLGNQIMFATVGAATAAGQMTVAELKQYFSSL